MGSPREEIEGSDELEMVFFEEEFKVASLSRGVAREVDDGFGSDFEEFFD